jgi:hypothetical protein
VFAVRPLYDTAADRRFFVAPAEWEVLLRAINRHNSVLISGPRGWGKTSMLRQVQLGLRNDRQTVAFVDATAVDEPLELLQRVRGALKGRPSASEELSDRIQALGAVLAGAPDPPSRGASSDSLVNEVHQIEELPQTTILLDASHSAAAVYGVFGRLRDLIWQLPHHWVVAVDKEDEPTVLKPPADAFYDIVLRLQPWESDYIFALLHARLADDELDTDALNVITSAANGNPRAAIRAANEALVTGIPPSVSLKQRTALLNRAGEIGRPHGMLMAELLDLGQASPSDTALLQRLGLSRARVTALLRELLSHGLVESTPEAGSSTSGRPRTIYKPRFQSE